MSADLRANAANGVHETVLGLAGGLGAGKVLDAPAGSGALSAALKGLGFDVWAVDIDPGCFGIEGISCLGVDLNGPLPFGDRFFDLVVCVEGIEHLENPHHLVRECGRVLKPGGSLIVTTPNVVNIRSRIKYFLFGAPAYFNAKVDIDDGSLRGHINPLGFPELEMILERNGFSVTGVRTNRYARSWFGLDYLIFGFLSRRFNKAYNPWLATRELLCGEILVVLAKKEAA